MCRLVPQVPVLKFLIFVSFLSAGLAAYVPNWCVEKRIELGSSPLLPLLVTFGHFFWCFCHIFRHFVAKLLPFVAVWTIAVVISTLGLLGSYHSWGQPWSFHTNNISDLPDWASLGQPIPKHLLRQNFPSKGNMGELSLRGKIFPLKDNFPLKIAVDFPRNALSSHEMKGLRERSFCGLRQNLWLSPVRGKKINSSLVFASKDVWAWACLWPLGIFSPFATLNEAFKVPEGRHSRGTTLRVALRGNLPLSRFSGAFAGVSSRVLRARRGAPRGSAGVRGNFPSVGALPHLVDFSWDLVDFWVEFESNLADF